MDRPERPVGVIGVTIRALMAAAAGFMLALAPSSALATDVRLVNYAAYSFMGGSAYLQTDGVTNMDYKNASGPLRLELWAFAQPYTAGSSGERLATYDLPSVAPGASTGNIDSGAVPFTPPFSGIWYFSMQLSEYTGATANDGFVVRYWVNFQAPEYIGVSPPPNKVEGVEFYHPGLDHYFIAATAQEISDLDSGVHQGWWRTGYSFMVWDRPAAELSPVCRYYIPPGYGDSHFFSASADECAVVVNMFPWLLREADAAFYMALPDVSTGICASDAISVYRLWNGRADSNHRYTTSTTVKSMMLAKGYIAEGYGPDQVVLCAPQ